MNDSFESGSSSEGVNLPLALGSSKIANALQQDQVEESENFESLKSPRYQQIEQITNEPIYQVAGYFTEYKEDLCVPALFRCESSDSLGLEDGETIWTPQMLFRVCKYLPLIISQTKMLSLNKKSRKFLENQNYGYFTMFLRTFNLPSIFKKSEFLQTVSSRQVSKMKFIKENVETMSELWKQRNKTKLRLEEFTALKAKGEDIPDSGRLLNVGQEIKPFTFYTDGGILYDDQYYSMLNLFAGKQLVPQSQIGYQAQLTENVTVCSYLGRQISDEVDKLMPHQMKIKEEKNNPHIRALPIEKYLQDPKEPETHKIISQMDYYQQYPTYEYRCQSFFMFTAEKEATARKSPFLKFFQKDEIPTLKAFRDLGLPLKQVIIVSGLDEALQKQQQKLAKFTWSNFSDTPEMKQTVGSSEACYEAIDKLLQTNDCGCICEIDVSQLKLIEQNLKEKIKASAKPDQYKELLQDDPGTHKKNKLEFVPFLYVWNATGEKKPLRHWSIKFEQTICAKYLITKIIDKQLPSQLDENQGEIYIEPSILFGQIKLFGAQLKVNF